MLAITRILAPINCRIGVKYLATFNPLLHETYHVTLFLIPYCYSHVLRKETRNWKSHMGGSYYSRNLVSFRFRFRKFYCSKHCSTRLLSRMNIWHSLSKTNIIIVINNIKDKMNAKHNYCYTQMIEIIVFKRKSDKDSLYIMDYWTTLNKSDKGVSGFTVPTAQVSRFNVYQFKLHTFGLHFGKSIHCTPEHHCIYFRFLYSPAVSLLGSTLCLESLHLHFFYDQCNGLWFIW